MKKILFGLALFIAFFVTPAFGATLVCDPPVGFDGVIGCEVEVNGVVETGVCTVNGTDYILKNLDGLPSGPYTFRACFIGTGGWPGTWSAPLDASKPGVGGGLRIKR